MCAQIIEEVNLKVFDMIRVLNELKTLAKHISCKCSVNLMVENIIQSKSSSVVQSHCKCKKPMKHLLCEEDYA